MSDSSAGRLDPNQPVLGGAATTQSLTFRIFPAPDADGFAFPERIRFDPRDPAPCVCFVNVMRIQVRLLVTPASGLKNRFRP